MNLFICTLIDQLWSLGYRIIVVDDGSGKEYRQIFDAISDVSIILHHSENRGKGAAIKTALNYVRSEVWDSDVIGVMDLDGQHSTEDMRWTFNRIGKGRNPNRGGIY